MEEPNLSTGPSPVPLLRRTRFVCISDTHNITVRLPKGDVLIHAGDLTNKGSHSELSKAVQWLEKADFEAKIVIAGNHDVTLDRDFYAQYGAYLHNQDPQDPEKCIALLESSPTITYLCHNAATVRLSDPKGPHTTFKIFGSPYSPRHGTWAFGYERTSLPTSASRSSTVDGNSQPAALASEVPTAEEIWSKIPLDTDILLTHTPPHLHCDEAVSQRRALGCEELRRTLWRVRPRLAICGHVHEGRGAERVKWDIDGGPGSANVTYAEMETERWEDPGAGPGNGKISLVDLTSRGGKRGLENDGSNPVDRSPHMDGANASREAHEEDQPAGVGPGGGTRGLGGNAGVSGRCDLAALRGRTGRRETCVVNCAVMANSYPHIGGKRFNKPIVVDLDLPVWE